MKMNPIVDQLLDLANTVEPVRGSRMAAAIVDKKGRILTIGTNKKKSHPFQFKYSSNEDAIFLHAETECILNYIKSKNKLKDLKKHTMYIVRARRTSNGKEVIPGIAKPCKGCQRALATFGIKNIVYTTNSLAVESSI